jgi:tetratricopeptide (TPR) repeat protein
MRIPHVVPFALVACFICCTKSTLLAAQLSSVMPPEVFSDVRILRFLEHMKETDDYKKRSKDEQASLDCVLDCGQAFLKSNDAYDAEGLSLIQKAKTTYPGLALPFYCEGRILGRIGKGQDALRAFTRAIELDPEFAEAYARRAVATMDVSAGNLPQATEDLKKAVSLKADSWVVSQCQGTLCSQQKQYADAMPYFETAISKAPTSADPYVARANNYFDWKKPDKTIEDCTHALAIKADDGSVLGLRGLAYQQVSQGKNAVDDFTKAIGLFDAKAGRYTDRPDYLGTNYLERGAAYAVLNDADHAASDFDMASSLLKGEKAGLAYFLFAVVKKAKRDYPGAMRALTAASSLLASNEQLHKQCEDMINSVNAKAAATPAPTADTPAQNWGLSITVNGVKETICTKDGHLTPKYQTKDGAIPLVNDVFHLLAPGATYYTNHATQLGDLTGANDGFTGFHEFTSDNGAKKWIYARFEADINFEWPDDVDKTSLQDVAVVIELDPVNMFILDAAAFQDFQSAGDVLYRNGRGVLWYAAK